MRPNDWQTLPLGDVTENFDALRVPVKEADRRPGVYPYYGATGIVDWVDSYIFDGEYVVIAEDGENLRTRKAPITYLTKGKFWVNNHAHILRGNQRADTRFLMYALSCAEIGAYLTGSTMPKLTQGNLNRIPVLTPPISEQRAIANILGTLDDKIELNRRMNETLEAMARAIFKSWFVDFDPVRAKLALSKAEGAEGRQPFGMDAETAALFPDSFQDSPLGKIPEGWCVSKVADLGKVICGKTPPTRDPDNYGQDVAFITIPDMHNRIFVTGTARRLSNKGAQFQAGKTIPTHSICVSCIATPGLVAITSEPAQTNQQINSVVPLDDSTVFYCYWVLRNLADEIRAAGSGGSVTLNLNKGQFSALKIVLAPRVLMESYQVLVEPLFARMLWNERELSTLTALRDALLPKLISGEIRVKDAETYLKEKV